MHKDKSALYENDFAKFENHLPRLLHLPGQIRERIEEASVES